MQAQLMAFCAGLNADSVAGKSSKARFNNKAFTGIIASAHKSEQANLLHNLAWADSRGKKNGKGKQAPSELQGFEACGSLSEIVAGLLKAATNPLLWREGSVFAKNPNGSLMMLPCDFVCYPPAQDTVSGTASALTGALKNLTASERFQMTKELLSLEHPDLVSGHDGEESMEDLIEGVRRQARRQGRIEAKGDRQESRHGNIEARIDAARAAKANGSQYDDGDTFIAQDGKIYIRTEHRRLLPVVVSTSTAGGQNSLANAASVTLTGAPTMELEIIKLRIVVEGGATNVEFQATLVASFAITSLKIGSVELIVGTGGVEFPMGDAVDPTFWSCLVVVGGNRNLTVTVRNEGATQVFIVSAYARIVIPA